MPTTFPAEIYNKGGTDKTLILALRTQMIYPFLATGWRDLRIGFLLSLTDETADDTITALSASISDPEGLPPQERYWIGIKDRSTTLPKNPGSWFVGFSNASGENATIERQGNSVLSSSDIGIGTTNAYFWRPNNSGQSFRSGGIWQSFHPRALSQGGVEQHFVQDTAGADGYATLLAMRIRRPDSQSKVITVTVPRMGLHTADVLFTNTPTLDLLTTTLRAFPTTVQQWGPTELTTLPDALYCYWPFSNSRLRIHALGILRAT